MAVDKTDSDRSSTVLASRALFTTLGGALAGSALGVVAITQGTVSQVETSLILSSFTFCSAVLIVLLARRHNILQRVATVSTIFFAIYLCACTLASILGNGNHLNLFIYLVWFFPLLVFNKLVNAPAVGRVLAKVLVVAPLLTVASVAFRVVAVFPLEILFVLASYSIIMSLLDSPSTL